MVEIMGVLCNSSTDLGKILQVETLKKYHAPLAKNMQAYSTI